MDSEESREASSGSESEDNKGRQSRSSKKSDGGSYKSRSSSRSSTPGSRAHSASSQSSTGSRSRPPSPEMKPPSRSSVRSRSPVSHSSRSKSPVDQSDQKEIRSPAAESPKPGSPQITKVGPRSPSSSSQSSDEERPKSPEPVSAMAGEPHQNNNPKSPSPEKDIPNHPRSPSPQSSFRSSSPGSPERNPDHFETNNENIRSPKKPRSPSPLSSVQSSPPGSPMRDDTFDNQRHSGNEDRPLSHGMKGPKSPPSSSRSSSLGSPPRSPDHFESGKMSKHDDNVSVKSDSSSKSSRQSRKSTSSRGSRGSLRHRRQRVSSDSSSDSSVDSSSRKNKNISKIIDVQPEEISEGDIESDHEKEDRLKQSAPIRHEINIVHEDLSDVSDLEDSLGGQTDNEDDRSCKSENKMNGSEQRQESIRTPSPEAKKLTEKQSRTEEGEEQLDFEAEDGECEGEITKEKDEVIKIDDSEKTEESEKDKKPDEELEEGEVTDEDDARPEETEPRPVCRFFSRGQCTWGASCRFLHPGVTDKGNYTMFEMIRPVVPGEFRDERMFGAKTEPPVIESAWERGLRTAKEMLRKSMKRKEQDIDFEEKKMNLSLAQEEFDKENGYYGRASSPEPRYVRHVEYPVARPPPEEYYGRRQVVYEQEYMPPPRERVRSYRELPSHRMPDYYSNKYEEEPPQHVAAASGSNKRVVKPKREVIVQRVESERPASGRGDEWSDPWMRSKDQARRKEQAGRKRSYSSGSSYSSSRSSSDSSKSSYRSRSRSLRRRRSRSHKGKPVSPSVIVSERKAANERAALMNPPAPKRRAPSPGMMRLNASANPPAPSREDAFNRSRSKLAVAAALARVRGRKSSRSSSGSSSGSSSDSDSSDSSSSSSRDNSPPVRSPAVDLVKAMDALKGGALEKKQIKLNLKNPVGAKKSDQSRNVEPPPAKKRSANSPPPGDSKSKKTTSRREELLKQLKAVEDAIAKKRSKVN